MQHAKPITLLVSEALRALDLVTAENSELYELWEETSYFEEWLISINKIKAALSAESQMA